MAGARGEATIQAGDREIDLLFTNRALGDVEQKTGRSILMVLRGLEDGSLGMIETAIMLQVGMEAARRDAGESGPPVALNTAYKVLDTVGFRTIFGTVLSAAVDVLNFGSTEDEGEGEDPNL